MPYSVIIVISLLVLLLLLFDQYFDFCWQPMPKLEHNAPGFGYEVTWKAEGDDEATSRTIPNWEQGRFEVPVDGIYQPYQVSVGAFNRIGDAVVSPVPVSGHSGEAGKRT